MNPVHSTTSSLAKRWWSAAAAPGVFIFFGTSICYLFGMQNAPLTLLSAFVALAALVWFVGGCARDRMAQNGDVSMSAMIGLALLLLGCMTLGWVIGVTGALALLARLGAFHM